ncbi:MAG: hypothetical protein HYU66_09245 [Armatimonadetes bacterium]|nr:hypothetical protein [Armatimonadota bacterium]
MGDPRDTIRELARQTAELAAGRENQLRRRRWCDVNSLRLPDRPPVICHPNCWDEILPRDVLVSQEPWLAGVEYPLRQGLHKWSVGDDTVLEGHWPVQRAMVLQGEHYWGLPVAYVHTGVARGAWAYDYPIKEESDLDKLVPPRYVHDPRATAEACARADELLGDILPVREQCHIPTPGAWLHGWATQLCGVTELLVHMMDRPAWVHRLMATLRNGVLDLLDDYERQGVLTLNNTGLMGCDDLPQPDFDGERVRLLDLWGRGESQEFQAVGPRQYEEFLLDYQKPILARSGLSYYGCCEDLTNKLDLVLSIPNLRRFICSPWTDLEKMVAAVGDRYCIEWRQKATDVAYARDLRDYGEGLREGLRIARGTPIMIVLQELETVNGDRRRLPEWAALAKELGAAAS